MNFKHPVKKMDIGTKYPVRVQYVEFRRDRFSDDIDILAYFEQPTGCMKGQIMKRFLDCMPEEQARKYYPSASWYNEFMSQQPSVSHLHDGDDMEEYERECLRKEKGQ
jgi:hypothetical protein